MQAGRRPEGQGLSPTAAPIACAQDAAAAVRADLCLFLFPSSSFSKPLREAASNQRIIPLKSEYWFIRCITVNFDNMERHHNYLLINYLIVIVCVGSIAVMT
jgi:hypothetical protein